MAIVEIEKVRIQSTGRVSKLREKMLGHLRYALREAI